MNVVQLRPSVINPPLSILIIIACTVVFLLNNLSPTLALWPVGNERFQLWQLLTYGFLHGDFNHLFFNMFALWMFGLPLERYWGTQRFALYYFVSMVGAGVIQLAVAAASGGEYPTIGASGGVFGLLLAYAATWPNARLMLLFFPVPIKAKWFVLFYGFVELFLGATNVMPQVAHFAHLGGMLFGGILLWQWGWRPSMTWRR